MPARSGDESAELEIVEDDGLLDRIDDDAWGVLTEERLPLGFGGWGFELRLDDNEIRYQLVPDLTWSVPVDHMLERKILPLYSAVTHQERVALHAGALAATNNGVLVIGTTGAGKSTTIYHDMDRHGAKLVADEMAVVDTESGTLFHGGPALRIEPPVPGEARPVESGQIHPELKKHWMRFGDEKVAREDCELGDIVVLQPTEGVEGSGELVELRGAESLQAVLSETFDFEEAPRAWKKRRFRNVGRMVKQTKVWAYRYDPEAIGAAERVDAMWNALFDDTDEGDSA